MESPKRYHPALVTLHWLMALLVFINLYLGIVVFEGRSTDFQMQNLLVTVHMAVGITVIVLLIVRFFLRIKTHKPAGATAGNRFFDWLAKFVHYGLYLTVLAVTVLGLVFSLQTGRFQTAFLGAENRFGPPMGNLPANNGEFTPPGNANGEDGQFVPPTDSDGEFIPPTGPNGFTPNGDERPDFPGGPGGGFGLLIIHELAAYLLLGLVSLHIIAALYHQFIRKDNLIARMWYGAR